MRLLALFWDSQVDVFISGNITNTENFKISMRQCRGNSVYLDEVAL